MKNRLASLFAVLLIILSLGSVMVQPQQAQAAPSDSACSIFPGSDGCDQTPVPDPGSLGGKGPVTKACPSTMKGFPSGNLAAYPAVGSVFYQCQQQWAKNTNGAYVPGTNTANSDSTNNGGVDYCHRNFTGDWLTQCSKGFDKKGQGSAQSVCGNNAACLVGFNAGGNANLNGSIQSQQNQSGNGSDSPNCEDDGGKLSW